MDWSKIIDIIQKVRHIVEDVKGEFEDEDPGVFDWDDLVTLLTEKDLGGDVVELVRLIIALFGDIGPEEKRALRALVLDMTDDVA